GSETEGLVRFFKYHLYPPGPNNLPWRSRVQLVGEGVQRGANVNGTEPSLRLYTKQYFRNPDDPTQVDCVVEFLEPRTALLTENERPTCTPLGPNDPPPAHRVTHYVQTYGTPAYPEDSPPVTGRMVIQPPRQQRPNGHWYYPVEREFYNEHGCTVWSATG